MNNLQQFTFIVIGGTIIKLIYILITNLNTY
jgi:hypothetical protein